MCAKLKDLVTWRGPALALLSWAILTSLWFAWLFKGPMVPMWVLSDFATIAISACIVAAILMYAFSAYLPGQSFGNVGLFVVALLLFGIPLHGMWTGGPYGYNVIAGIFPYSDAAGYEQGAERLMQDGRLDGWNTRRPLNAVALGSLLSVSNGNLQITQAFFVYLNAAAAFLAAVAMRATHGLAAALLMLVTLFAFYQPHVGSFLSENIGLALGSTAFALLWCGIVKGKRAAVLFGLFALSVALNARAGAFFVLPALIIWLSVREVRVDRRKGLETLLLTAAAVVCGFLPSMLVSANFGGEQGIPFGNFAPSLYGLAVGGKGWTQVYVDFPHVASLAESDSFKEIYRLAFTAMGENPLKLLKGIALYYNDYIFDTTWHQFFDNRVLRAIAIVLTLTGLVYCIRNRREPALAFLLVTTVGVLLSVPFLYDGAPRAYAATISVTAAFIGIGATRIAARFLGQRLSLGTGTAMPVMAPVLCTLVVVFMCAPAAWLYAESRSIERLPELPVCPEGEVAAVADVTPGRIVMTKAVPEGKRLRLPFATPGAIGNDFSSNFSVDLPVPATVIRFRDRVSSKFGFAVVADAADPFRWPERVEMCGRWVHDQVFIGSVHDERQQDVESAKSSARLDLYRSGSSRYSARRRDRSAGSSGKHRS